MKEEKKNKSKILKMVIAIVAITISIMLANSTNTYAVLQANPTTHGTPIANNGSGWILQVRTMEATGGTMGLNAIYDSNSANTLMESTSNNIDVHMMKTTEYGAIVILAASGYGAGSAINIKNVTTNNATGVYFKGEAREMTAAVSTRAATVGNNINERYYDNYENSEGSWGGSNARASNGGPKAGDGLGSPTLSGEGKYPGCAGWFSGHNSTVYARWFGYPDNGVMRNFVGGYFAYDAYYTKWTDPQTVSRGVAVVGQDL